VEALRAADPDLIVVLPCALDLAHAPRDGAPRRETWLGRAARGARWKGLLDRRQPVYFNRPGPRLVESLEILAEILHPAEFPARHRGSGWEPYS
jgi:iron complex transport system substrate-binding protein